MYEEHFGIKGRPFPVHAGGAALYRGRHQERVLAGLRKAMAWPDAVITLTGPVGSGKSVLVDHMLEGIGENRVVARIARLPLARDELLELLLAEFGISDPPEGRIQRFSTFRRLLAGWAQASKRIFVVVEDALYLGTEALVELESLTAADGGDTAGVQLLLMGPPELREALQQRNLVRLRQRMRLREQLPPMEIADTQDYLRHAFGRIGADIAEILEPAAIETLHRCSDGIPRLTNNLCEAAMIAAAETGSRRVQPALVERVAVEQFGHESAETSQAVSPMSSATPAAEARPDLIQDPSPGIASQQGPTTEKPAPLRAQADRMRALRTKTEHTEAALPIQDENGKLRADLPAAAAPPQPASRRPAKVVPPRQAIPEPSPITPTLSLDLSLLEPRAPQRLSKESGPQDPQSVEALEQALLPDTQLLRSLEEPSAFIEDTAAVPLGLRQHMQGTGLVPTDELPTLNDSVRLDHRRPQSATAAPNLASTRPARLVEPMPEITLDRKLDRHKQEAAERVAAEAAKRSSLVAAGTATAQVEPEATGPITADAPLPAAKKPEPADPRKEKLTEAADNSTSATSIEEIGGTAAETLFGEQFSQLAAAVASMASPALDDNESPGYPTPSSEPTAVRTPRSAASAAGSATHGVGAPVQPASPQTGPAVGPRSAAPAQAATKPKPAAKAAPPADIDASASRRLEMVRALNGQKGIQIPSSVEQIVLEGTGRRSVAAGPKERPIDNQFGSSMTQTLAALNVRKQATPESNAGATRVTPAKRGPQPEPIENQFGLSMTQTLNALSARSMSGTDTDDDDEEFSDDNEPKGGFFSRFRRS